MEYINVISKEIVTQPIQWPIVLSGVLTIVAMFIVLGWEIVNKRMDSIISGKRLAAVTGIGISIMLVVGLVCSVFFRVPTEKYKYEATIDKDKITVAQYEDFIKKHNPIMKDDVYYWEE